MMSYRESTWLKSRTFEITPDALLIRSWGFARRTLQAEFALRLADIIPEVAGRSWMKRNDQHSVLFGVVAVLSVGGVSWLAVTAEGRDPVWLWIVPAMLAALVLVAGIAVLDPRRTEYALFNNRSAQVVLGVGRIGPDADQFDFFIARLQESIRAATSTRREE
jgi:hypothetical protein